MGVVWESEWGLDRRHFESKEKVEWVLNGRDVGF